MAQGLKDQPAGYSGKPLAKKLGIKPGFHISLVNAPRNYFDLFTDLPAGIFFENPTYQDTDLIHFFTKQKMNF